MTQDTTPKRPPTVREPKTDRRAATKTPKASSRLDQLEALLTREQGASIAEMVAATGWQQHSVRGAMAGAPKTRRGLVITSEKVDGVRRYHASRPA